MAENYSRRIEVTRESVNEAEGTFEAVLFTDGEATDGHVLDIAGMKVPSRMPLFVNHVPDPIRQPGSLYLDRKTDHEVVVRGEIEVGGHGAEADVRRDLLYRMAKGHVKAMSGRWDADPKHVTRRVNLAKDHPAYVDTAKLSPGDPRQYGLYFAKSTALEGSIVGLGADPQALIRWADEDRTPEGAREFYRTLALAEKAKSRIAACFDGFPLHELERVDLGNGREFYVPEALARELETLRATLEEREEEPEAVTEPVTVETPEATVPPAAEAQRTEPVPTTREAVEVTQQALTHFAGVREDLFEEIRDILQAVLVEGKERALADARSFLDKSLGRVT